MTTTLYLVRHGATAFNVAMPPRLQGRGVNAPLTAFGVRQAELTRDFLAICPIDVCYSSPLERALQTASILTTPHRLSPIPVEELTECDVGAWEGLSWEEIAERYPRQYERFKKNPARHGYPKGETFADVYRRSTPRIIELLDQNVGNSILIVGHHVVNRTFLAGLMGLPPEQAPRVQLDNCSISVVIREAERFYVKTVNSHFHLMGAAA